MQKTDRTKARKRAEQKALVRKSERMGIPVQDLIKPKHRAKRKRH